MNMNLTLLMQAVAFALFIWFCAKFIWPPLTRAIDTRQRQIAEGLQAGEQGRQSLASAQTRIEAMLNEAKQKAAEIVATGEKFRNETIEAARGEAQGREGPHPRVRQGGARSGGDPREGAAAQPGGRSCRRGRSEDPAARSRRQGPRGPARLDPQRVLSAMAESITVARPYAEAAFGLAREQNALESWSQMLKLVAALLRDERVAAALDNPRLGAPEKESLLLGVAGDRLNEDARSYVRVLVQADRIGLMPEIAQLFDTLKDREEGTRRRDRDRVRAHRSAARRHPQRAGARFGKRIDATVRVNPALIGGARVTVGDTVLDASVQAKLAAMATELRA
jgi:F-type H+-transporting ATPase subunit delta